ncbi:MAG: alkaline phosphatase [Leptolyngbya foveolarum]|uniref:Alkaline phosphatase n=1 Tax=Leptolyngbya foveolarum TaxID=47253 RepID=A0A2W4WF17_9CYAN|nr:MAG: alkaline phosphatase [Leptolyngbya foveolarum]
MTENILTWVTNAVTAFGYWGIAFMMFLENLIPPIPSELVMPLAGYAASQGELNVWSAIAFGSVGSLLGALLWYYIGLSLGLNRLKVLLDRYGRWVGLSSKDLDNAQRWFLKRGTWTVGICRMIPGIRTYVSIPAGVTRMPLAPFFLYSTAGTVLWTAFLTLAGYFLGNEYERIGVWLAPVAKVVIVVVAVTVVVWLARRISKKEEV